MGADRYCYHAIQSAASGGTAALPTTGVLRRLVVLIEGRGLLRATPRAASGRGRGWQRRHRRICSGLPYLPAPHRRYPRQRRCCRSTPKCAGVGKFLAVVVSDEQDGQAQWSPGPPQVHKRVYRLAEAVGGNGVRRNARLSYATGESVAVWAGAPWARQGWPASCTAEGRRAVALPRPARAASSLAYGTD